VSAVTQLTHEGSRSLVNCSPQCTTNHILHLAPTWVVWAVSRRHQKRHRNPLAFADGLTFARPFAHCMQYYSQLHTA